MLAKDKHRIVTRLAYFDQEGARRMVMELGVALSDGRVKLVYKDNVAYLIVTPEILWMTGMEEKQIQVKSNTNWLVL